MVIWKIKSYKYFKFTLERAASAKDIISLLDNILEEKYCPLKTIENTKTNSFFFNYNVSMEGTIFLIAKVPIFFNLFPLKSLDILKTSKIY